LYCKTGQVLHESKHTVHCCMALQSCVLRYMLFVLQDRPGTSWIKTHGTLLYGITVLCFTVYVVCIARQARYFIRAFLHVTRIKANNEWANAALRKVYNTRILQQVHCSSCWFSDNKATLPLVLVTEMASPQRQILLYISTSASNV